jgi:hypothetical protein
MQYVIGCLTQSAAPETLTPAAQDGCTGVGCCQVALSSKLSYHDISVKEGDTSDDKNSTTSATIDDDDDTRQRCRYAMVVEAGRFKFHAAYLNSTTFWDERDGHVPTILNWAVGNTTCDVARQDAASYACRSSDSVCVGSATGLGYLCNCSQGYRGNPYLVDGCQGPSNTQRSCHSVFLDCRFLRSCSYRVVILQTSMSVAVLHLHAQLGLASTREVVSTAGVAACHSLPRRCYLLVNHTITYSGLFLFLPSRRLLNCTSKVNMWRKKYIYSGISVGVVIVAIAVTCSYLIRERKKLADIKQRYFRQHGGLLLLEQIGSSAGAGQAFTIFTEAELMEATGRFGDENVLGRGGHGTVYRGALKDGTVVAIKRCVSTTTDERRRKEFGREMLILSQVNHKNIVKLLGCCLEVEVPMLVYEFVPNGTLFHFIHGGRCDAPLSTRLKIAHQSALALDYLHSCASPPILHGDVKSSNILLDDRYAAKVSDFGASVVAPADEAQFVTLVQGTCGYLDPEYMQTCQLTDKSDVYSFGVVLLELVTGRTALNLDGPESERSLSVSFLCALKEGRLMDVVDDRVKGEDNVVGVLEEVADLARQCLEMAGENRPAMRDAAERLGRLSKLVSRHPWVQRDPDEMEMESLLLAAREPSVAGVETVSTAFLTMERSVGRGLLEFGR